MSFTSSHLLVDVLQSLRNILPRQLMAFNIIYYNTINNNNIVQEHPRSTSYHAILAFIVPTLVDFIEVKFQGTSKSPFDTHPLTLLIAVASLLLYCVAYGTELAFSHQQSHTYAENCQALMKLSGTLALASLATILFPQAAKPVLYVLYALLLVGEFYDLARKLHLWSHRQVFRWYNNWHLRRAAPVLPLTSMDSRFLLSTW